MARIGRGALVLCLVALGTVLFSAPAHAQKTTFNPTITFNASYYRNLGFTPAGDADDAGSSISVLLPVQRTWRSGRWMLTYQPSFLQFRDFQELDRDEHRVRFLFNSTIGRRSSIRFGIRLTTTQEQGNPEPLNESELFLTQATDRKIYAVDATYSYQAGENTRLSFRAGADQRTHRLIMIGVPPTLDSIPEDRTNLRLGFTTGRTLTKTLTLSGAIDLRSSELEISGREEVVNLSLSLSHELTRNLRLGYGLGLWAAEGQAAAPGQTVRTRTGLSTRLSLTQDFRRHALSAALTHIPSSGGNNLGTSTNSTLTLNLSPKTSRVLRWQLSAFLAYRDASNPLVSDLLTASIRGGIERRFARWLGLRLDGRLSDQERMNTDAPATRVARVTFGLAWYPLAKTEIATGS